MAGVMPPAWQLEPGAPTYLPCSAPGCKGHLNNHVMMDAFVCTACNVIVSGKVLEAVYRHTGLTADKRDGDLFMKLLREEVQREEAIRSKEKWAYKRNQNYMAAVEAMTSMFFPMGPGAGTMTHPLTGPVKASYTGDKEQLAEYYEATAEPREDEALRAWRAWLVCRRPDKNMKGRKHPDAGETMLRSVTYQNMWLPQRPYRARCALAWRRGSYSTFEARPHVAPDRDCACGIYAKTSLGGAVSWAGGYGSGREKIVGSVSLWGHVLLFQEGYRAEYAYPYCLYVPKKVLPGCGYDSGEEMAHELRQRYLCDVEIVDFADPPKPEGAKW